MLSLALTPGPSPTLRARGAQRTTGSLILLRYVRHYPVTSPRPQRGRGAGGEGHKLWAK